MQPNSSKENIETILRSNNIPFNQKGIQHGIQIIFDDGAVLSVYNTGRRVWGGKETKTKEQVDSLIGTEGGQIIQRQTTSQTYHPSNRRVFIVYGHDTVAREQLELLLRRLHLEPVILQNLPAAGETIIEKLEGNTEVRYACVLLTPDDEGYKAGTTGSAQPRARQNVILEMGMFLAKLGRKRVSVLHKGNIELPSDINGLLYLKFDDRIDEIKERIAAELQEAGFDINIKDLLS